MGYKEKELTEKHGDLHKVIPVLVNQHGQHGASQQLGVTQSFISYWLRKNDYMLVRKWVRETENA
jgi:hypothetical protein